ncbi:MAG: hypothetical protein COA84_15105 [Robiginitomaculum sp.]|nr:MAG: hypothetical protein COA84_15105 [Robiginitomaculum sp.]
MANPVRGEVEAEFRGKKITLKLTMNAMCALEDKTGRALGEVLEDFEAMATDPKRMVFKDFRVLFWAAMIEALPDATVEDAGELMSTMDESWMLVLPGIIQAGFGDMSGSTGK